MKTLFYIFYFLTGLTSLVLEVVWTKKLSYIMGVGIYAASATVGTFMLGLSLGSFVVSKSTLTAKKSIQLYGIAQIIIGLFAIGSLAVLSWLQSFYSFTVIIVPSTLMGMTFPLLINTVTSQGASFDKAVQRLYAINTFGAVAGCLVAAYLLIPELGLTASSQVAAVVDILIGVFVLWMARRL